MTLKHAWEMGILLLSIPDLLSISILLLLLNSSSITSK